MVGVARVTPRRLCLNWMFFFSLLSRCYLLRAHFLPQNIFTNLWLINYVILAVFENDKLPLKYVSRFCGLECGNYRDKSTTTARGRQAWKPRGNITNQTIHLCQWVLSALKQTCPEAQNYSYEYLSKGVSFRGNLTNSLLPKGFTVFKVLMKCASLSEELWIYDVTTTRRRQNVLTPHNFNDAEGDIFGLKIWTVTATLMPFSWAPGV